MRLLRLGRWHWDVLATLDAYEVCEVLDFLRDPRLGQQAARRAMFSFLRETVPQYGPQEDNPEICLRLHPYSMGLYEFRKQPRRGPKVRVVWFHGEDRTTVVCATGFLKTDETPQRQLDVALARKQEYFRAVRSGLKIEDL